MNELTFLDLAILKKVDADSSVEKFGSIINTSFFETANLLGNVKIKGYVNIESSVGGISSVKITDAGTSLLTVAEQRSKDPVEPLDNAILHEVAGGNKELESLQAKLNIRSGDLAFHLYKLVVQGFMDYEVRSAKVTFVLTEQGFNATGGVRVQQKLDTPGSPAAPEPGKPPEESEEIAPAERKKEEPASAPPWVRPADVAQEKKEDVAHLMKEEHGHEHKHEHKHKKPLSPAEEKKLAERRRFYSKIEFYATEYAPYAILILIVIAVFLGAIYLSLQNHKL
jgi:hypothetical protein